MSRFGVSEYPLLSTRWKANNVGLTGTLDVRGERLLDRNVTMRNVSTLHSLCSTNGGFLLSPLYINSDAFRAAAAEHSLPSGYRDAVLKRMNSLTENQLWAMNRSVDDATAQYSDRDRFWEFVDIFLWLPIASLQENYSPHVGAVMLGYRGNYNQDHFASRPVSIFEVAFFAQSKLSTLTTVTSSLSIAAAGTLLAFGLGDKDVVFYNEVMHARWGENTDDRILWAAAVALSSGDFLVRKTVYKALESTSVYYADEAVKKFGGTNWSVALKAYGDRVLELTDGEIVAVAKMIEAGVDVEMIEHFVLS